MSFIRCLSNPDGAYVYHHVNGNVVFTTDYCWSNINSPKNKYRAGMENPFYVPSRYFYGLVKKFIKNYHSDCNYGDFSIKECDGHRKYILTYKGRSIKLWQVTWSYIVNNAEWRFLTRRERNRRLSLIERY